jgi:hypothetical protein
MQDAFTAELIALAVGTPSISVSFTLQEGDWLRFSTEDNALLDPNYLAPKYGFGISTVVAPSVPEVPTKFMSIFGGARRRGSRPASESSALNVALSGPRSGIRGSPDRRLTPRRGK